MFMLKPRLIFSTILLLTLVLGLLSRQFAFIPIFVGDIFWATAVFLFLRIVFIKKPIKNITLYSLIFCFGIEFSQLYKAPWIDGLRQTLFGRLVLGNTFLWGDLLCYVVGIGIAVGVEGVVNTYKQRL
jgi:hypothetical protein